MLSHTPVRRRRQTGPPSRRIQRASNVLQEAARRVATAQGTDTDVTRDRISRILVLGLPIVGGMISQNVLDLVDTAMVGVLGPAPLAAVAVGSYATFLSMALLLGVATGVQAMTARRRGEGGAAAYAVPLNAGLLLAVIVGLPLTALLLPLAPALFPLLNQDPAVLADGIPYFETRLWGILPTAMNFAFRGYWNGLELSLVYLRTIVTIHLLNILLNWVFIFGNLGAPEMGAPGAGLATTLAVTIGTALHLIQAWRQGRRHGFLAAMPGLATIRTVGGLAVPSSIQMLGFAAGLVAFLWIIGQVGTPAVAVSGVIMNLLKVALLPGLGLGLAALSLVSQALGAGNVADARRWGWDVTGVAAVALLAISLPAVIFPDLILAGFLHEPALIDLARGPLRLVAVTTVVDAFGMILMNAMLGAGAARTVMSVTIVCQWAIGLPLAWLFGVGLEYGVMAIWICQVGYRALQAVIFMLLWARDGWTRIRV